MGKTRRNNISFFMKIYINPDSSLAEYYYWYSKKSSWIKCNLENCKVLNFCLDSEEEIGEDVDNTWDFKRK